MTLSQCIVCTHHTPVLTHHVHVHVCLYLHMYVHVHVQELEKQASRKLRINAKETMRIAEKLYTQG